MINWPFSRRYSARSIERDAVKADAEATVREIRKKRAALEDAIDRAFRAKITEENKLC